MVSTVYIYINFVIRNTAMFVSVYKEPSSDNKTAVFLCSLSICNQCTNSVDVVCLWTTCIYRIPKLFCALIYITEQANKIR